LKLRQPIDFYESNAGIVALSVNDRRVGSRHQAGEDRALGTVGRRKADGLKMVCLGLVPVVVALDDGLDIFYAAFE
jgi:hypothetical protein